MASIFRQAAFVFFGAFVIFSLFAEMVLGYRKGRIFPEKLVCLEKALFANLLVAGFSIGWVTQDIIEVLKYYPSHMSFWMNLATAICGWIVMYGLLMLIKHTSVRMGKYVEWKRENGI